MKKIMKLILVLMIILSTKNVYAQDQYELTKEEHKEIYYSRYGKVYASYPFTIFRLNDIYAYCIEPGNHITTYNYVEGELDSGYNEETKEKLELIGYYGREYPGHDNIRYSMAAQALVWELTGSTKVTFWTKKNEEGEEIDVSKERNEIMNLVNKHKVLPTFSGSYNATLNHELILEDTNNVLENYEVTSSVHKIYKEGNKLHIIPQKVGIDYIHVKRKDYNSMGTIIFVGEDDKATQKMARLHYNKEIKTDFYVVTEGIRLVVHKLDENNNPVKIENIKFRIRNLTKGIYICSSQPDCIHKTNKEGVFITEPLDYGEYEIEELEDQVIPGYTWNNNKLNYVIKKEGEFNYNSELNGYIDISFKNESIKGSVEINKKGEEAEYSDNVTYKEINLSNIEFDLYSSDNKLIKTVVTNNNGYAKVDDLSLGKYYLIEKTKLDNYIKQEKQEFEIKQDNQYQTSINVSLNIKNILKKGRLELDKVDSVTYSGINKTTIEIYRDNNTLLLTKETNEDGKIIIDNLPYGKYYIKEKEANYDYEISNEIINFEIIEDGEVIKKTLTNKRIVGELEIIKQGEKYEYSDNDIIYEKELLKDIEFSIYDDKDNLIGKTKTNNSGSAKYSNLSLGKYYLVENTNLDNYVIDNNKYYFEITKDGKKTINLVIDNYLKKGYLEFTKEDLVTGEGIANTIIEIYNENDSLLFTKETDERGKVIINNLPIGKYYIIEKEANSMYMLTNEKVFFEIKEDGEIVKAKMTNEKIEIPVVKTSTKESIIAHSLFGIGFLIGIGRLYYERKYTY